VEGLALLGFGIGLLPIGFLLLIIVAVTGGRNEPDPDGERPAALYYAGVMYVAVFAVLFAVFTVVASLLNLTTDESGFRSASSYSVTVGDNESGFTTSRPIRPGNVLIHTSGEDDADYAAALRGVTIAIVAAGVYLFHDQRRRQQRVGAVGERVKRTYQYVVSFTAVITAVVAASLALYAIFQVLAPGVTGAGTRGDGMVQLAQSAFLAAAAGALFLYHLRAAEPPAAPTPPPPEPPAPPAPVKKVAVKKAAAKKAAR